MSDTTTVIGPGGLLLESPIADFEFHGCIGEGAFGQVYLARSKATGRHRAIKVVRRDRFQSEQPYEVEFAGLKRFEEVSREHAGFVDILHVRRDDQAGYFSYVMELADDLGSAQPFDPGRYVPRTLANEVERRGHLSPAECVRIGLALSLALAELHARNLVHRDINPRNIIFVRGAPKLADVGLVTEAQVQPQTLIGTPDYMDPAVHGTPEGDLFGFGRLLYVTATGLGPKQWPELPKDRVEGADGAVWRELEAIWRKACHPDRRHRYRHASEIHHELLALQAGASVLRLKRLERMVGWCRRYGFAVLLILLLGAAGAYAQARQQKQAAELRQRKIGAVVANGNHALDAEDYLGALLWFAEAWRLDTPGEHDLIHRVRLGSILRRAPELRQIWFQDHRVKEAYFPSEENQVVMADATGRWRVYDRSNGQPLYAAFGRGSPGETASLSRSATLAVTAASTNQVWLWNYHSGSNVATLELPAAAMGLAAISPDGHCVAAVAQQGDATEDLVLWENPTASPTPVVFGSTPPRTHCLVFSPDSKSLLTAGTDRQARVWEVATRRLKTQFSNHQGWIFNGAFSPDSRLVATASWDRSTRVWEADTGKELDRFQHDDAVWGAEFSPDGAQLATAGLDSTARIWDLKTHRCIQLLRHNDKVLRAAFSPQGGFLLTSCFDDTVRVWQLPSPPTPAPASGWLALGGTVAIVRTNGDWCVQDQPGGKLHPLGLAQANRVRFCIAPDDRFFAALHLAPEAVPNLRVQLYDAMNPTTPLAERAFAPPPPWTELGLSLSPGGEWLAAFGGSTGTIWNLRSDLAVNHLARGALRAAFSPDGELIAIGRSNQVEVCRLRNPGETLARWSLRTNSTVSALEWDGASRRLITSCMNPTFTPLEARTWVARTGAPAGPPLPHRDGVLYATFSHKGVWAITCSEDFTAILWDPKTGRQLAPPMRHRDQVIYATFSQDDRLIATVAADQEVIIWRAETGERLTSLTLPLGPATSGPFLSFTPDDQTLLIRTGDGLGYTWDLAYCDQPLEDVLFEAQLRSAHETDRLGSLMPASRETVRRLWETRPRAGATATGPR